MPDQIMRFLNSLGVIAWNNQRKVTKSGNAATVGAKQANNSYFLFTRLLTSERYIRRGPRGRNCQTNIALGSQSFKLPGKDILEPGVVGYARKHAAIGRQRDRRQSPAILQELINHLPGDMLCVSGRTAVAKN